MDKMRFFDGPFRAVGSTGEPLKGRCFARVVKGSGVVRIPCQVITCLYILTALPSCLLGVYDFYRITGSRLHSLLFQAQVRIKEVTTLRNWKKKGRKVSPFAFIFKSEFIRI